MSLIADLKPEEKMQGCYLCKYKQLLKNKNGKDYLTVKLQDETGTIEGKIWAIHPGIEEFQVDDVVQVEAEVVLYQENLQANIGKIKRAEDGTYDLNTLLPRTPKDVKVLEAKLFAMIDEVQDTGIKKLLETLFYDETIYKYFMMGAAAKSVHHAYLGGLLEHTVTVAEVGKFLASCYEPVNLDLVIAGCLLHDIGKLYELSAFPKNDYTDEGQLLGHIMLGVEKVNEAKYNIPELSNEALLLIKHTILAHHGEYEYGSPKRPKCIEAMIVHLADYSDSKLKMFEEVLRGSEPTEQSLGYHKVLTRNMRRSML
ncbi:MAG: HD domain-containing protein [Niameybacter sp.]|uniref:3'-5' exoribonuclease YhaM family protein n=1 Tax=Niameybacter sp. TaxID=2033640 RepID=UPI002FC903BE